MAKPSKEQAIRIDGIEDEKAPCADCKPPKRYAVPENCHSTCKEYIAWSARMRKRRAEIMRVLHQNEIADEHHDTYYDSKGALRKRHPKKI